MHEMYDTRSPLTAEGSSKTRGHSQKLKKIRIKTELRQNFFSVRVTDVWNSLPESIVNAKSLNCFKNKLDTYWINQAHKCQPGP